MKRKTANIEFVSVNKFVHEYISFFGHNSQRKVQIIGENREK
jgi:hypothetical protein